MPTYESTLALTDFKCLYYGQEYPGESYQEEIGIPPCEGHYEMPPETYGSMYEYPPPPSPYIDKERRMLHHLPQGQVVKLCYKSNPDYVMGRNRVRDPVGHPTFFLVNKDTGQDLHHVPVTCQEVLLTRYEPGSFDEDVMWTQSEDMDYGFRTIRMANNIDLNLDAFQGDCYHRGIQEGTCSMLWKWNKQDNQLWKINPCY
eukprot:Gb_13269 [translate_table: standard]